MRKGLRARKHAGLVAAALLLAACNGKETGPDRETAPKVPDVASPPPIATAEPALAKIALGFEGTDLDRDGTVSSSEYAASSARLFGSMDANDDGSLTVAELDEARTAMRVQAGPSSEKLIMRADNDGDVKLTLAEFVADTNDRFATADTDGDGKLSVDEYYAGHPEVSRPDAGPEPAPAPAAPAGRP